MSRILELPPEIILLILPHLTASEFLSFAACCKTLHAQYINEPTYWATVTRKTFRVANQPVVQKDGARWRTLYKRLKTQTRAYGWGQNQYSCLGQDSQPRSPNVSWPKQIHDADNVGVISDMQCGGWSTSLLTSDGSLRVAGLLDGMVFGQMPHNMASPLRFPPGFTQVDDRYDSRVAIRQYSHGRAHILALSDSGRIWSWRNAHPGLGIKFVLHETIENRQSGHGVVHKVVAGWNKSAAWVEGSGIVIWEPIGRVRNDGNTTDTTLILESAVIPESLIGQLVNFILLENVVIFNTDTGKAYMSKIIWTTEEQSLGTPIEICIPNDERVTDVQGAFKNFAVFTESGSVFTSTQDRLLDDSTEDIFDSIRALQHNNVIALAFGDYHFHALHAQGYVTSYGKEPQSCGALGLGGHATPEGRLRGIRHQRMHHPAFNGRGDGSLVPHALLNGRQVWFEREKQEWIRFLTSGGADPSEAADRMRRSIGSAEIHAQGEVSEWIEQEGRDWEDKYHVLQESDDGLPAHFVLNIAAGGWHSAALVLVNSDLATRLTAAVEVADIEEPVEDASTGFLDGILWTLYDTGRWFLGVGPYGHAASTQNTVQTRSTPVGFGASPRPGYRYTWSDDHFPRLKLTDGTEMPGTTPLSEWRYGEPQWEGMQVV